jgi:hypothetical protein
MNADSTTTAATTSCIAAESPLVFMHLPKTGGMSMFTAFTSLWGTAIADLYNVSPRHHELALQAVRDKSKVLYCGHYAFGLHEWLDRPAYYATVLREPVARIVSLYHYCQPMLQKYRERLQQVGGDLHKLSALPKIADFYLDFEPWLRGEPNAESFFASPCAELDNGMVRRFSGFGLQPAPCPEEALSRAKETIERSISVVGLLERYPETLRLMAQTFGLPALHENRVNANSRKEQAPPLSDAVMETIRDMNRLDQALYDWAAERFERQLTQPLPPVKVPGGARTDSVAMPLWRSVGRSPLREAAMQQRGVPSVMPQQAVVCAGLRTASVNETAVLIEVDTILPKPGERPSPGPATRLVFHPQLAKAMVNALTHAIDLHEEKYGPIPQ